ncbi:MAG TPA: DUF4293 family protein [Chitinophagaceae bacterium]|nr:DUF4293 family protein [Chitinophagaceae bacterium]
MIQRIQTIWLLLAAVAALLTFKLSFYSGNITVGQTKTFTALNAAYNIPILMVTCLIAAAALLIVFLYKNRKLQMRMTLATIIISLFNLLLYYNQTHLFAEGSYDLTALLSLSIPVFLVLAARGIYKDQKLVKSLDRLR